MITIVDGEGERERERESRKIILLKDSRNA